MLFNSLQFVLFFIILTLSYFTLPHNFRWLLLLLGSCFFYMSFIPVYIFILGFTIVIDYFAGIMRLKIIDVYSVFAKNPQKYYFRNDTHWNSEGIRAWIDEFNKVLEKTSASR